MLGYGRPVGGHERRRVDSKRAASGSTKSALGYGGQLNQVLVGQQGTAEAVF